MSYRLIISIDADSAGRTWTAQLYDADNVAVGSGITTGFSADPDNTGDYIWDYSSIPDDFTDPDSTIVFTADNGLEFTYRLGDVAPTTTEDEDEELPSADQILENALSPKRATGDSGSVEQHSIPDQITADRYARSQAASIVGLGIRTVKLIPPGAD